MNKITLSEAQKLAMDALKRLAEEQALGDLMIIEEAIVETDAAWYFPYDATAFVLHGNISSALAGNLPVKVSRDGTVLTYEMPPAGS
jgi:Immunity protein 35